MSVITAAIATADGDSSISIAEVATIVALIVTYDTEIVAELAAMARANVDATDGELAAAVTAGAVDLLLTQGGDNELTTDEAFNQVVSIFGIDPGAVSEPERKALYALREGANAVSVTFETFCAEADALRP